MGLSKGISHFNINFLCIGQGERFTLNFPLFNFIMDYNRRNIQSSKADPNFFDSNHLLNSYCFNPIVHFRVTVGRQRCKIDIFVLLKYILKL